VTDPYGRILDFRNKHKSGGKCILNVSQSGKANCSGDIGTDMRVALIQVSKQYEYYANVQRNCTQKHLCTQLYLRDLYLGTYHDASIKN
jgi:hypothetical protein